MKFKKNRKRALCDSKIVVENETLTRNRVRAQMNFQRNEILHKNLKIKNCETRNLQTQYQTINENETKISQMQANYVLITQLQKTKNEMLKKNVQMKNTFKIEFQKKTFFDFFVDEFFFCFR